MTTYTLTAKQDFQTGELGYCFDSLNINDELVMVGDSLLLAHDLLEHQNGLGSIGSIHDELIALGGILFVRGYDQVLRRDNSGGVYSFDESLASDVVRMYGELSYIDFIPTDKIESDNGIIDSVVTLAREGIIEEYDRAGITFSEYKAYIDSIASYMQQGYDLAEKRYTSQYDACQLFWTLEEALRPHCDNVEYEGQQLELTVDYSANLVHCEELYEEYEEDEYAA